MKSSKDLQANQSIVSDRSKKNKIPIGTITKNFFDIQDIENEDYVESESPTKLLQQSSGKNQEDKKEKVTTHHLRKKKTSIKLQPMKNANPKKIDLPDFNQNQQQPQTQNPQLNKKTSQPSSQPQPPKKQPTKPTGKLNFHLSSSDQEQQVPKPPPKRETANRRRQQDQQRNQEQNLSNQENQTVERNGSPSAIEENGSGIVRRESVGGGQVGNVRPLEMKNTMCFILRRHKQWFSKLWPQFNLHSQVNNQFKFSGKITGNNTATTTIISQSIEQFNENGNGYLGKIKSNFIGNLINIYGPGYNPSDHKAKQLPLRNILTTVEYETNFFGSTRPRNFRVFMLKPGVEYYSLQGTEKGEDQVPLSQLYQKPKNKDKILVMVNRKPQWNEKIKGFMLNFGGRVKKPSIKNFILQDEENPENTRLIFGKIDDDQFRLDIGEPLNPFIGFGIALSTFGGKIGCQ